MHEESVEQYQAKWKSLELILEKRHEERMAFIEKQHEETMAFIRETLTSSLEKLFGFKKEPEINLEKDPVEEKKKKSISDVKIETKSSPEVFKTPIENVPAFICTPMSVHEIQHELSFNGNLSANFSLLKAANFKSSISAMKVSSAKYKTRRKAPKKGKHRWQLRVNKITM